MEKILIVSGFRTAIGKFGGTLKETSAADLGAATIIKNLNNTDVKPENVPLGKGRIDPKFFDLVKQSNFSGPFSLHVEYLGDEGLEPNLQALQDDLVTLKQWLQ